MKRIHVVGVSPRTGTTLMVEAIKTCFDIDHCSKHEDRLFTRAPGTPDIFLSKAPRDIMVVGPSLKVDPNLFVICIIRDPRDIITSKHKKDPDRYWAGLKFWNLYTKEFSELADHPHFIPVYYEKFVSNPDAVQKKIDKQIPFLEKEAPFSRYHEIAEASGSAQEALNGVRPIKPTSVGKWENHKPRVRGQIQRHGAITQDLITYGYEKDDSWLRELDDVQPNPEPSHFSEYMSTWEKLRRRWGKYCEAARRMFENLIGNRIRITHPKKWFA